MATISDCRAIYGLVATGTPSSSGVTGSVQIGVNQTSQRLTTSDVAYTLRAIFAAGTDSLVLDLTTNDTTGSTAWAAGTPQVETATVVAASGITTSGNATVTVTAVGMTGSPKAISVALTTTDHTTATLIAAAIATALNADADYAAMFTATSSGADVITTRKSTVDYTVGSTTIPIYATNDITLNVAIANDTCAGITAAPTSANTTLGVATSGVKIYDGDGTDFEGEAVATIATITGLLMTVSGTGTVEASGLNDYYNLESGETLLRAGTTSFTDSSLTFIAVATTDLTITVIGSTT